MIKGFNICKVTKILETYKSKIDFEYNITEKPKSFILEIKLDRIHQDWESWENDNMDMYYYTKLKLEEILLDLGYNPKINFFNSLMYKTGDYYFFNTLQFKFKKGE